MTYNKLIKWAITSKTGKYFFNQNLKCTHNSLRGRSKTNRLTRKVISKITHKLLIPQAKKINILIELKVWDLSKTILTSLKWKIHNRSHWIKSKEIKWLRKIVETGKKYIFKLCSLKKETFKSNYKARKGNYNKVKIITKELFLRVKLWATLQPVVINW